MKRFESFLVENNDRQTQLSENWMSKGFALVEGSAHRANKQKVNSLASQLKNTAGAALREKETISKLNKIAEALQILSAIHSAEADMSSNSISIAVSNSVMNENISDIIDKALKNNRC